MHLTSDGSIEVYLEKFAIAPFNHPELLPSLLPLIMGFLVIELYFGKHTDESLGWNTSVGNAIIWLTTGINLLITTELGQMERYATYSLAAVGGFVAYMDFYHKWPSSVAFSVSSSAIVYSLAYILVVMVKTGIPIVENSLKAGAAFFVGVNALFKIVQVLEPPARDQMSFQTR